MTVLRSVQDIVRLGLLVCEHLAVCLCVQTYVDGKLTLEQKVEDGTRKGPIDPDKRSASILVGEYV